MSDARTQLEKVLKEPDTRQAMDCGNVERGPAGSLVTEINYLPL
jgi:hypothetical protein